MEKRTDSKMVDLNSTILITPSHINGLTTPIFKRLDKKSKTQLVMVSKEPTLNILKTHSQDGER